MWRNSDSTHMTTEPVASTRNGHVLILMYHEVSARERIAEMSKVTSSVLDAAAFAQQMDWLVANKLPTVSLGKAGAVQAGSPHAAAAKVVLSFDDGYIGNFCNAFSTLMD